MTLAEVAPRDASQWQVYCTFTGANGTPLESYSPPAGDVGATWVKLSSTGATLQNNQLALSGSGGTFVWYRSISLTGANYSVFFNVQPASYAGVTSPAMWVSARTNGTVSGATGFASSGYRAMVSGDGSSKYYLYLIREPQGSGDPALVNTLGTLSSGYWQIQLGVTGTTITVAAQRSADGLWLQPDGTWSAAYSSALTMVDGLFTAPGYVMIGGANN